MAESKIKKITPAGIGALSVDGSNAMHHWITIDTSSIPNNGAGIDIAMPNNKHWYLYPTGTGDAFTIAGNDGTTWFWTLTSDMTTGNVLLHNPLGIISGGTGAATPGGALENLGIICRQFSVTFNENGWGTVNNPPQGYTLMAGNLDNSRIITIQGEYVIARTTSNWSEVVSSQTLSVTLLYVKNN